MQIKSKQNLRERILTLLRNQKEEDRLVKSLSISDKLFKMPEFKNAETVLFYASFDGEVETFEMIKKAKQMGKKIGLPKVIKGKREFVPMIVSRLDRDLVDGPYGIKEPNEKETSVLDINTVDMVIVPGLAFDKQNHRLGRGGGYYDRFLSKLPSRISTIGLAFDFQIIERMPHTQEHDMRVSCVLTN